MTTLFVVSKIILQRKIFCNSRLKMNLNSPEAVKSICKKYNVSPQSWKGQNFLIDQEVLEKIVSSAELKKDDIVLEIGPGFGILTKELAQRVKKVIAVEIDRNIIKALKDILKNYNNIEVINEDILKLQIAPSFAKASAGKNCKLQIGFKIVANIPYGITGKFLRKILESEIKPRDMVLLVQKEVAERIIAKAGKMSLLALAVQFYSQPEIIAYVSRKSFFPEPEVDSAIIKFKILSQAESRVKINEKEFFRIAKIGFSSPRKQLHNNLSAGLKIADSQIKSVFEELNFNFQIRAQELSVEDWKNLLFKIKSLL